MRFCTDCGKPLRCQGLDKDRLSCRCGSLDPRNLVDRRRDEAPTGDETVAGRLRRLTAALRAALQPHLIAAAVAIVVDYHAPAFRGRRVATAAGLGQWLVAEGAQLGDVVALPDARVAFDAAEVLGVWDIRAGPRGAWLYAQPGAPRMARDLGILIGIPDGRLISASDAVLRIWTVPSGVAGAEMVPPADCVVVPLPAPTYCRFRVGARLVSSAGPAFVNHECADSAGCAPGRFSEPRIGGACLTGAGTVMVACDRCYVEYDFDALCIRRWIPDAEPAVPRTLRCVWGLATPDIPGGQPFGEWAVVSVHDPTFSLETGWVYNTPIVIGADRIWTPPHTEGISSIRLHMREMLPLAGGRLLILAKAHWCVWDPLTDTIMRHAEFVRPRMAWALRDGTVVADNAAGSARNRRARALWGVRATPDAWRFDAARGRAYAHVGGEVVTRTRRGLAVWNPDVSAYRARVDLAPKQRTRPRTPPRCLLAVGERLAVQTERGDLALFE